MSLNNKYRFEDLVKEKVDSFDMPGEKGNWAEFEKDLQANMQSPSSNFLTRYIANPVTIVSFVAVITAGYFLFTELNDTSSPDESDTSQVIVQDDVKDNKVQPEIVIQPVEEKIIDSEETVPEIITPAENNNDQEPEIIIEEESVPVEEVEETADTKAQIPSSAFSISTHEGCAPLNVSFMPLERSSGIIYLWDFGDGEKSTEMTPDHKYKKSGIYDVSLTVKYYKSDEINTFVNEEMITVREKPEAKFVYDRSLDNSYKFSVVSSEDNQYSWDFGDNENETGEVVEHNYVKNGTYIVSLTAMNADGCVDSYFKEIKVKIKHNIYMPEAFTPNNDVKNELFGPHKDILDEYKIQLVIVDLSTGQVVFQSTEGNCCWDGTIKGRKANPGKYTWKMTSVDKYGNVDDGHHGTLWLIQ